MHPSYVGPKGCHFFCSIGWLERKLIVVYVVDGFLFTSTSSLVCLRVIVRSRKAMELCSSYVGLFYVIVYFVYVSVDGVQVDFCCVIYN